MQHKTSMGRGQRGLPWRWDQSCVLLRCVWPKTQQEQRCTVGRGEPVGWIHNPKPEAWVGPIHGRLTLESPTGTRKNQRELSEARSAHLRPYFWPAGHPERMYSLMGWVFTFQSKPRGKAHVAHTAVPQVCSPILQGSLPSISITEVKTYLLQLLLRKRQLHSTCGGEALLWTDVFKPRKWMFLKLFSSLWAVLCRSLCWILVISSDYCG